MNKAVLDEALARDAVWSRRRGLTVKKLEGGPAASAAGKKFFYREISESGVGGDKVRAAIRMADDCQRRLKIPTIFLGWFYFCDRSDPGAKFMGTNPTKAFVEIGGTPKILLRADLSPADLQLAAAHECHHIWMESQPKDRYASLDAADRENSANAFAFMMWKEVRDADRPSELDSSKNW
ncbi:MAG: hypothetical protein ABSG19_12410 [Candidatus Aminicenantales bacterium]